MYTRTVWTGGTTPTRGDKRRGDLRRYRGEFFREYVRECGGLDLWECAGTSALERARIFWNRATLDAWATVRDAYPDPLTEHDSNGQA
jgi:hypothetical protein